MWKWKNCENRPITDEVMCRSTVAYFFGPLCTLCPIHTADSDATKLSSCVASAVWTHTSAVVTQFTISCAENWQVPTQWRHCWKSYKKIHEYYTTQLIRMFTNMQRHMLRHIIYFYSIGCRIVNALHWVTADGCVHIAESVGSRRELVANSCTHADATQLDSFVVLASAVCIGH